MSAPLQPLFVTGTDTEIGKTWATLALIRRLQLQGLSVAGMKPIASGCDTTPEGLRNDDALQIQKLASLSVDYAQVNPYAFAPPIAPHIAAQQAGVEIDLQPIQQCAEHLQTQADILVVEGVGGWRVPLGVDSTLIDLVRCLDAQVVLVVGLRLGCINHACLTAEVIIEDECRCVGWIANSLTPDLAEHDAIMETLQMRLPMPLLGRLPYQTQQNVDQLAASLIPLKPR